MITWLRIFWLRLTALFLRRRLDDQLDEELGFHLQMQIKENLRNGMNPQNARNAALRSFGGVDQAKENCHDARGVRFIEDSVQDIRYGLQMIRRNPGLAAVAVMTLTLGIGANTAVFSVVNAVLLRPLPFPHPEELVQITAESNRVGKIPSFRPSEFQAFQRKAQSMSEVSAYRTLQGNLTGGDQAERVKLRTVSANLFSLLVVQPRIGRAFEQATKLPAKR